MIALNRRAIFVMFGSLTCLYGVGIARAADDPAWTEVEADLNWSLKSGQADKDGVQKMVDACAHGDVNFMGELQIGFAKTQSHNQKALAAFDLCQHSDPRRLYNLARRILGMAPV